MELPAEIERLSKLRYLDLQGNELQEIPAGIGRLQQLSYLNMDRNALKRLPASIGQLQQLQELNLGSNALEQLPPEIGGLSGLSQLKLEENKLRQLPPEIGRLQGLQWLELGNNELQQLPPELGQLFQLQFLGLRENHLQALPPAIGQLQQLEQLDLRNNSLTHLPSEIGRLQQLRQLNLFDNQLQELPVEINQLHQLESILFSWNRLIRLPGQLETWDNEVVIDAFIQEWRTKHALRAPYPERDQHFDREMEYLYTTRIRLAEQDPDQPALRQLYRDLAWFQLITGQFAAAETTIRKNMALAPDDPKAALLLPHSLLFQGKTAAATNAYLELKDHQQQVLQVDGHNISTRNAPYSEAFLQDLEEFERMKIVPEGRQKQVEIIRQLLRE
jgi:Leucine-rich repeat (LRR) protein